MLDLSVNLVIFTVFVTMIRIEHRIMNIRVYHECFDICNKLKTSSPRQRLRQRDYPAAVVACSDSWCNVNNYSIAQCGKVDSNTYRDVPALETSLANLGCIGSIRSQCKNRIGSCAEPHAAKAVMLLNSKVKVNDLVFSYAYRPRTKSVIRYCRNCTGVFNVSNP